MSFSESTKRWGFIGSTLIGLHLFINILSKNFDYTLSSINEPVWLFVTILFFAGIVYLTLPFIINHSNTANSLVLWIVTAGFLMRLCLIPSTPILEDDYYRYLWDGAVLSKGFNPYMYSPDQVMLKTESMQPVPYDLRALAIESDIIIERINHPHLRTIYPPIAQLSFMLAFFLKPWSLIAWKAVLLLFDSLTVILIIMLLKKIRISPLWAALYWWNPLLIKEIYNSGHMDVILLPFVLGAIILFIRGSHYKASVLLACAAGVKVWPVILFPFFLRPFLWNVKKITYLTVSFAVPLIVMILPVYVSGLDNLSGFTAYSQYWQMNDALFMTLKWGTELIVKILTLDHHYAQIITRVLVIFILAGIIIYLNRNQTTNPSVVLERSLIIIAALFIFSPTQFPWYYVWILPFLTLRPRYSLVILTPFLSLYYLRFYYSALDDEWIFDYYIVWIEYIPLWFLLLWEWYRYTRGQTVTLVQGEV